MKKKSYAKVNIFLKILGKRGDYHEIISRFVRVEKLFDVLSFEKNNKDKFYLEGDFSCKLESNTIYKAYKLIKAYKGVEEFFKTYSVKVKKNIPEFAGLGGGSSNAATFLLMANEYCNLELSKEELSNLAIKIGADVPFFIYEYNSANVRGIGELVEEFKEEPLDNIQIVTPKIMCNTGQIYKLYRQKYYKEVDKQSALKLLKSNSIDILNEFSISQANDLFAPAIEINKELLSYAKKNYYFSGSGSSFFKVNNG